MCFACRNSVLFKIIYENTILLDSEKQIKTEQIAFFVSKSEAEKAIKKLAQGYVEMVKCLFDWMFSNKLRSQKKNKIVLLSICTTSISGKEKKSFMLILCFLQKSMIEKKSRENEIKKWMHKYSF